ncbi:hypothetical protein N0V92_003937 [Colletotrichum tropicale]|nr:hypothetical protein N0V92_003937 [Colletotrichum tropicale]
MPSGPSINVTSAKDAEIGQFLAPLSAGLSNAVVHSKTMQQDYNQIQSPWLELAVDIHRSHQRTGAQAHNLDRGSFLREIYNPGTLGQLLMVAFEKVLAAVKKKHAGKLANAQKAMELSETIELHWKLAPRHLKAAAPAKASVAVKRTLQREFRARGNDEKDEESEDPQSSEGQTASY